MGPGGFTAGPLRMVRIEGGELRDLPKPDLPGRLDSVFWINDRGLALMAFDMRGHFIKPEQSNPNPGIAIVDASTGRLRDHVLFADLPRLPSGCPPRFRDVTAAVLADARAVIVVNYGPWMVWTEGEPTRLSPPFLAQPAIQSVTLAPDGTHAVVERELSRPTRGTFSEFEFAGPPVEGVLLSLVNLSDGSKAWDITARAVNLRGLWQRPVISPDGRYALADLKGLEGAWAGLPDRYDPLGLISMDDGSVLQVVPAPRSDASPWYGFGCDSRSLWILSRSEIIAHYDLAA